MKTDKNFTGCFLIAAQLMLLGCGKNAGRASGDCETYTYLITKERLGVDALQQIWCLQASPNYPSSRCVDAFRQQIGQYDDASWMETCQASARPMFLDRIEASVGGKNAFEEIIEQRVSRVDVYTSVDPVIENCANAIKQVACDDLFNDALLGDGGACSGAVFRGDRPPVQEYPHVCRDTPNAPQQ